GGVPHHLGRFNWRPATMPFARMALIGVATLALGVAAEARTASGAMDIVLPAPHPRPAAVGAEALRPAPQFDGCGSTAISCNTELRAQLFTGDCLASNGTLFDEYVFTGEAQELVTATVRPLSATYTNAWVGFIPPPSDTALSPLISGGPAATVRYSLPVTGTWRLQLGTNDRFALGDYLLDMACDDSPPPSPQLACVEQDLLCGQQATWELSSLSCIASSDPNRVYAMYRVYGVGGDTLNIRLTSSAFDPQFGIYEFAQSSTALAQSSFLNPTTDTMAFPVPHNGFYDILVTSGNVHGAGQYTLALDCSSSGCLTPIITQQPQDVTVQPLSSASLTVQATALGDVDYEWFDAAGAHPNVGSGPRFGTPPVTAPHDYYVTATTPCGTTQSRTVHVQPAVQPPPVPPRHHAVRH
ncbi:MAG TPA: hypothetical protein VNN08_08725, partial [Thermoanaerobaculia bacterium]|nr:hypothetical protein [Thermoanaerobaculia bacterium]